MNQNVFARFASRIVLFQFRPQMASCLSKSSPELSKIYKSFKDSVVPGCQNGLFGLLGKYEGEYISRSPLLTKQSPYTSESKLVF